MSLIKVSETGLGQKKKGLSKVCFNSKHLKNNKMKSYCICCFSGICQSNPILEFKKLQKNIIFLLNSAYKLFTKKKICFFNFHKNS